MQAKQIVKYIPYLFASLLLLKTLVSLLSLALSGFTYGESIQIWIAGAGLLLVLLFILLKSELWHWTFIILLILGLFRVIRFTGFTSSFSIGPIEFEPIILLILIVHVILNIDRFSSFFSSTTHSDLTDNGVDFFKNQFKNKSIKDLKTLANNEELVPDARKAAEILLKEKDTSSLN